MVADNPWCSMACNASLQSYSIVTWPSSLWVCVFPCLQITLILIRTLVIGFRAQLNKVWPHINLITSLKTLFPNKVTIPGSRGIWVLEEHYSNQHTRTSLSYSSHLITLDFVSRPHHEISFPQNNPHRWSHEDHLHSSSWQEAVPSSTHVPQELLSG